MTLGVGILYACRSCLARAHISACRSSTLRRCILLLSLDVKNGLQFSQVCAKNVTQRFFGLTLQQVGVKLQHKFSLVCLKNGLGLYVFSTSCTHRGGVFGFAHKQKRCLHRGVHAVRWVRVALQLRQDGAAQSHVVLLMKFYSNLRNTVETVKRRHVHYVAVTSLG